jgi:hypothetical protein
MRGEFIRGKPDGRPLGNKQAGSFAAHTHGVSDPGHGHTASQPAHAHSLNAHSHGVSDPGHAHGFTQWVPQGTADAGGERTGDMVTQASGTSAAGTGISIQATGDFGMGAAAPGVTVNANTTGISLGATGGTETVPQNIALDYYIKAIDDSAQVVAVTGITSSDEQMIGIDSTNPVVPHLVIHSNVAFGTVKLDASGKIPLNQVPQGAQQLLGFFDASSGNNPSQAFPSANFASGDTYIISVGGSIECFDPVTLVSALRPVAVGSLLQWIEDSLTNPTGWYTVAQSSTIAASSVIFAPVGAITATNVQDAIVQVQGNIPTTASQIAYVPGGSIAANTVQAAVAELDTETQAALALKSSTATTVTKDSSTGAALLPVGTQLQRPASPVPGMLRFNDDSDGFEGFNGTNWGAVGGGATGSAGNPFVYENDIHVTANYQLTANKNGMSAGPITIDDGVTVTVPPGSVWSVV